MINSAVGLQRNLGKFYIAEELLNDGSALAFKIMANCLVVRAEFLYWSREIEYVGMSRLFDRLERGSQVPTYDFTVDEHGELFAVRRLGT